MARTPIPGLYLLKGERDWADSADSHKRRHFVVEGQVLKLFGRRGKTYKDKINLLAVTALRPATDASAPAGALQLEVLASRSRTLTHIFVPDHSADDLFMALGNAVPSHATSEDLWRRHMGSRPAPASDSPAREYRVGATLGTGTFGKVKLAQRADGSVFAIKCLNRSRIVFASQGGRLAKEIRLLKLVHHPNVIRLHEVLHTPSEILMVMEYVDGGDLLEVLNTRRRFDEHEVRGIFSQVVCGVAFCHSLGVVHRDLKPENILLGRRAPDAPYFVKVADFGLSALMKPDELLCTACGSPHYVAPEILDFSGDARYDGRESDVWSLGVILHVMLCYKLPFEADCTQLLYKKIRLGLPTLPAHLSGPSAALVGGMLKVLPAERLSLAQVAAHEWLQLQGTAPQLSLTVDAVVDFTPLGRGSDALGRGSDLLSASSVFALNNPGAEGRHSGMGAASVRRAFTFDTLPRSFDENDLFPRSKKASPRLSPVGGRSAAAEAPAGGGAPGSRDSSASPGAQRPALPVTESFMREPSFQVRLEGLTVEPGVPPERGGAASPKAPG